MNDKFYRIYHKPRRRFMSSNNTDIYTSLASIKRSLAHRLRGNHFQAEDFIIYEYSNPTGLKTYDGKEFSDLDVKSFNILYGEHEDE